MTLLDKLKALFGLGGDSGTEREAGVTVEREPSETTTAAGTGAESGTAAEDVPEAPSAEETATEERDAVAEADAATETDAAAEGTGESPDVLNGIGPAYAERLADAGVDTVADLAAADAAALADATDISEKRLAGWIESAEEHLSGTA